LQTNPTETLQKELNSYGSGDIAEKEPIEQYPIVQLHVT